MHGLWWGLVIVNTVQASWPAVVWWWPAALCCVVKRLGAMQPCPSADWWPTPPCPSALHPTLPPSAQGLVMTVIAWRFNFTREAAKALARAAARTGFGSAAGDGSLRQPLLEGRHCERLEAGMLLDPAGLDGEEEEQQRLSAAQEPGLMGREAAGGQPGAQWGQLEAAEGEELASPKEQLR